MTKKTKTVLALLTMLLAVQVAILILGCDGVGITGANTSAECDTVDTKTGNRFIARTIRCTVTVHDTVYVPIEFEEFLRCVEEVLENPPHGVPMEIAIRACIPAQ